MKFTDKATLKGVRKTADGYLVADVYCARAGIQQYTNQEMGLIGDGIVNVLRDESEVFNKDSLATYVGKPVTDDHPLEPVTAANWKVHATGQIGEGVLRDGEYLKVPVTLMDAGAIAKVDDGKVEISMGYTADIEFIDGVTDDGDSYQAKQKNIKINHLAIVDKGRAGSKCRIGDNATHWGASPINPSVITGDLTMTTQKVMVDGLTVETTEQGAQAIAKLQSDNAAMQKQLSDSKDAHQAALDAKDKALADKDAEIDKLKKAQLDDAALDAKVAARADLLNKASHIAKDTDFAGKSDADIKKAAVTAALGDAATKDKSEAYIDARFDILVEDAAKQSPDTFADAMAKRKAQVADNGQAAYEQRLNDAWKQEA